MKTWFVQPDGACYSIHREGVSSIENLEFSLKSNLMTYGSLVALITAEHIWLATEQEHLDHFIDQCIGWYMQDRGLVPQLKEPQLVLNTFECVAEAMRRVVQPSL